MTARCLDEDLNASEEADFDAILGLEIVKAFVKDRASQSTGARQVTPLTCGLPVYRLAYGNDHRGATLHDEVDAVIWLLAYGRHRSGKPGDFFPVCKGLDADGRLSPPRTTTTRERARPRPIAQTTSTLGPNRFRTGKLTLVASEPGSSTYRDAGELREAGDLRAAAEKYLLAAGEFEAAGVEQNRAASLVEAGRCLSDSGDAARAIAPFQQAASVIRRLVPTRGAMARRDLARVLTNLGQAFGQLENPEAAFGAFEEALSLTSDREHVGAGEEPGNAERLYAWTALSVGKLYRELKRSDEARGYLSDAYEVFTRFGDERQSANAANNLGAVCNDLGEHEDALSYFEAARDAYLSLRDDGRTAIADANIGRQQLALGQFGPAATSIDAALSVLTRPQDSVSRATVLTTKSALLWATDAREQALIPLQEAAEIYAQNGRADDHASATGVLAGHLMELGRFKEGLELFERSIEQLEHAHDTLRSRQLRAFYLDRINEAYGALVGCYVAAGRDAAALDAAERAKARTLALLLTAVEGERSGEHQGELVAVQRELGTVHSSLQQLSSTASAEDLRSLERQERELQLALRSVEARLGSTLISHPAGDLPHKSPQTAPRTRELLLEYVLGSSRSYLIAALGHVVEAHVLPPAGDLERAVRELRDALQLGLAPTHSHSLYKKLLGPVEHLLDATEEIVVVPDGALVDLPFSVLTRTTPGEHRQPGLRLWSSYTWLARSHAVRYAPSSRVARALEMRQARRSGPAGEIAAFAVPFEDSSESPRREDLPTDATRAAARVGAEFGPLPFAYEEVLAVCGELGLSERPEPPARTDSERIVIRSHTVATKEAVAGIAASRTFRYWHFACHGLVDFDLSDHSGLVLADLTPGNGSDCYWRAYEVAGVSMPCDLATLSACDTGLGHRLRGEGVFGLARAFFTAGADAVCVSMWPILDQSTSTLMRSFYRGLARGESKPQALRSAQREAIDRDLHPRHWGAFTLIGAP